MAAKLSLSFQREFQQRCDYVTELLKKGRCHEGLLEIQKNLR